MSVRNSVSGVEMSSSSGIAVKLRRLRLATLDGYVDKLVAAGLLPLWDPNSASIQESDWLTIGRFRVTEILGLPPNGSSVFDRILFARGLGLSPDFRDQLSAPWGVSWKIYFRDKPHLKYVAWYYNVQNSYISNLKGGSLTIASAIEMRHWDRNWHWSCNFAVS